MSWLAGLLGDGSANQATKIDDLKKRYDYENIQAQTEGGEPLPPFPEWAKQFGVTDSNAYKKAPQ